MFVLIKYSLCILLILHLTRGDLLFPEYHAVDKMKPNLAVSMFIFKIVLFLTRIANYVISKF